jgi:hypothetical protein
MTTVTEEKVEQTPEQQGPQLSGFEFKTPPGGPNTVIKDDTTLKVAPDSAVEVNDTGRGVQVKRTKARAPKKPNPGINFKDAAQQIVTTYGATVTAPANGPASVVTNGAVTLVNPNATAPATAEATEPETGLQLSFTPDGVMGTLDGTEFDIAKNNVAVNANRVEVRPAAEASKHETDIEISISEEFNRASLKGENFEVRIELDEKGKSTVYSTAGGIMNMPLEGAQAGLSAPAIEANEQVTRLALVDGKIYGINNATGEVTTYDNDHVRNGGSPELAGLAPVADGYQITLSRDGKRIGLNGSGLEKTAEGGLVAATDGVGRFIPVEAPAVEAAPESDWYDTGIRSPRYKDMIMIVAKHDLPGTPTLQETEQTARDAHVYLPCYQEADALSKLFNDKSFDKTSCDTFNGKPPGEYWIKGARWDGIEQHPTGFSVKYGSAHESDHPYQRYARLIQYRKVKDSKATP